MGSDNRSERESPEGAEALIRRVKRAKDSTNREPSGSGDSKKPLRKTKPRDVEGVAHSSEFVQGYIRGLYSVKDTLGDPNFIMVNSNMKAAFLFMEQLLDSQIAVMNQLIEKLDDGENVFLPSDTGPGDE